MANFSPLKDAGVRMAVLEEKLTVYEELSKEMLSKLESAVDKISEANQNVAKILVRHEERLDQSVQTEMTMMKLLDELKEQRKEDIKEVKHEIQRLEAAMNRAHDRISEISKYRWIFAGALLIFSFLISESNIIANYFRESPQSTPIQIQPR
jgi:chromosome segregation ATPase